MTLSLRIAEVQRTVAQLEDDLADVSQYPLRIRTEAGLALSDLAVRLELARIAVLEADDEPGRA